MTGREVISSLLVVLVRLFVDALIDLLTIARFSHGEVERNG